MTDWEKVNVTASGRNWPIFACHFGSEIQGKADIACQIESRLLQITRVLLITVITGLHHPLDHRWHSRARARYGVGVSSANACNRSALVDIARVRV
jgi:hypothetical protein